MHAPDQEMVFEITCVGGGFPDIEYPRGRELSVFFPAGHACVQLNYGQGEGQVLIDGAEWGFYYSDKTTLHAVLHEPGPAPHEAAAIVAGVCARIEEQCGVRLSWVRLC